MNFKKIALSGVAAAVLGLGGLMASATSSSAYVVCNHDGDCWHTERREHVPAVQFSYHPDDWYFHQHWDGDRDHHYRDYHEGRGYYRGGIWIPL